MMNEVTIGPTSLTVRKVRNGAKVRVELLVDGAVVDKAGGNRADRAKAVMVALDGKPGIYGLRGDIAKAQAEAASLRADTRRNVPCRAILKDDGWERDTEGRPCTTSISSNSWDAAKAEGRTTTAHYVEGHAPYEVRVLTITEEVYGV